MHQTTQTTQTTPEHLGDYLELILDPVIAEDPAELDSQFRGAAADAVLACYEPDGPAPEYRHHRNQYIREHRHLHTTAASLLQATADYLRDLAGQTR